MKVNDIFEVKYGVNLELINCEITNDYKNSVNFVSRTSENNGIVARVAIIKDLEPHDSGAISCATSGSVLSTFVQLEQFYSGRDLYVLTPKIPMTLIEKLFYCYVINMNKYRYSYGRAANKTLKDIELPNTIPAWVYKVSLGDYYTKICTENNPSKINFNTSNWQEFKISDLFNVMGTKTTKLDILSELGYGEFPFVTTQATNNGVCGYYDYYTEDGNILTADSAVTGYVAYQEKSFSASDHVEKLIPKFKLNKYIGLFLATVLNQEQYRYSYGRKFNQVKIRNTKIRLPADKNNMPDWHVMEEFIKQLPYSDKI